MQGLRAFFCVVIFWKLVEIFGNFQKTTKRFYKLRSEQKQTAINERENAKCKQLKPIQTIDNGKVKNKKRWRAILFTLMNIKQTYIRNKNNV